MTFPNGQTQAIHSYQEKHRDDVVLTVFIKSSPVLIRPTTGDVNLDNPLKLVTARCLNHKVIIFPFVGGLC